MIVFSGHCKLYWGLWEKQGSVDLFSIINDLMGNGDDNKFEHVSVVEGHLTSTDNVMLV